MNLQRFIILVGCIVFNFLFAQPSNIRITTNNQDQSEASIAIDPLNANHLLAVWNDFQSDFWSEPGYGFTTNGGSNWSATVLPNHDGYSWGADPSAAFDRYGNAFYCYVASPQKSQAGPVYVSRTTNDGPPWFHTKVSSKDVNQDKPFMAVDNTGGIRDGRIYVSWTDLTGFTKIKFSYSSNAGASFSPELIIDSLAVSVDPNTATTPVNTTPSNPTGIFLQGSMPAVGPTGEVYVVWQDINTNDTSYIKIRKSTNGGESFGSPITVRSFIWRQILLGGLDDRNFPALAVDPNNGYVYIAMTEGTTPRIKFTRSTNGGSSWSSAITIGNLGELGEMFPWVVCDEGGKVAVTFMHVKENLKVDCYVMESYDNGVTFRTPVKVSSTGSDPNNAIRK